MLLYPQCFCGVNGNSFDRLGESTACTMPCSGDSSETCGGRNAISVYYSDSNSNTYLGCYADEKDNRIMEQVLTDTEGMTIMVCKSACSGYAFFGTQYGEE
ncbi:unnamed protein product, partial [Sphacelaria rigidula]